MNEQCSVRYSQDSKKGGGNLVSISLFKVESQKDYERLGKKLDERQRKLLEGAINYHSLVNPGKTLVYRIYLGTEEEYPVLTDLSSLRGQWAQGAKYFGKIAITSKANTTPTDTLPLGDDDTHVGDKGIRYIRLSPTLENDADAWKHKEKRFKQRIYDKLETTSPLLLDGIREALIQKRIAVLGKPKERYHGPKNTDVKPPNVQHISDQKCLLFGLHWFQTGGAERWAIETIGIAKKAGYLPIVLTDQASHHPWITRPELDDCILLPLAFPAEEWDGDDALIRSLFENFAIKKVMVHHSGWLYGELWWIKKFFPSVTIYDSTHIIEYLGGGYPGSSAVHDDNIDVHHVISPALQEWMTGPQKIPTNKIALAPLVGLTVGKTQDFKPRDPEKPFTVTFIGRLARQKRPDVFLLAAKKLLDTYPNIRFILHGDGELAHVTEDRLAQLEIADSVWRRGENESVPDTLAESDLLLLTSANEGLALTVIEAISAGVPVISTNVGSQSTLVPPDALLPRSAHLLIHEITKMVAPMVENEKHRETLWKREARLLQNFSTLETANEWWTEELA